jgi:hypothetical protein
MKWKLIVLFVGAVSAFSSCKPRDDWKERVEFTLNRFYTALQNDSIAGAIACIDEVAFEQSSKEMWEQMMIVTLTSCGKPMKWELDTLSSLMMNKEKGRGRYVNAILKVEYKNCTLFEKLYIFVPSDALAGPHILSWGMADKRESIHVSPEFL